MNKRWFISPVLGTGTKADPYRAKARDLGVTHTALIPCNNDGTPKFAWCLIMVEALDFTALDADAALDGFPGIALSDTIGSLSAAARNKIQTALAAKGVDLTGITLVSTIGDVLQRAAQTLIKGWNVAGTDLA